MQTAKLSALFLVCALYLLLTGCVGEQQYGDLKIQNDKQQKRIADLEAQFQAGTLELEQVTRKLQTAGDRSGTEINALQQKIAALTEDRQKTKALITAMRQQLLRGGAALPVELSSMLEDFAKDKTSAAYDSDHGIVKFESDLLFESGSDTLVPSAQQAIKSLCEILNSEQAREFDIIIAGHTDDMRIARPRTRAKHPTNWHLSAHRAISVLNLMTGSGISTARLSIRGFGEYRPLEPNKPNNKGNPRNRRVEIYIIPKGL